MMAHALNDRINLPRSALAELQNRFDRDLMKHSEGTIIYPQTAFCNNQWRESSRQFVKKDAFRGGRLDSKPPRSSVEKTSLVFILEVSKKKVRIGLVKAPSPVPGHLRFLYPARLIRCLLAGLIRQCFDSNQCGALRIGSFVYAAATLVCPRLFLDITT